VARGGHTGDATVRVLGHPLNGTTSASSIRPAHARRYLEFDLDIAADDERAFARSGR
jgi:hypothetical protein